MSDRHLLEAPVAEGAHDQHMVVNMGPQHPATHGVLRVVVELDGEIVVRLYPDLGFLHTGIEKTCEAKFYHQVVPLGVGVIGRSGDGRGKSAQRQTKAQNANAGKSPFHRKTPNVIKRTDCA